MSSDILDMAILCKEAAKSFIENTEDFEVVSECMKNSDVFIVENNNPKRIGMVQGRDYQRDLIIEEFGEDIDIVPMMGTALPYAFEKGEVDGIIIDFIKSLHIEGEKRDTVIDKNEYTSYVLLVNKEFKESREFGKFISDYNQGLKDLNQSRKKLEKHFYRYTKSKMSEGGLDKWKIRLLYLEEDQNIAQ